MSKKNCSPLHNDQRDVRRVQIDPLRSSIVSKLLTCELESERNCSMMGRVMLDIDDGIPLAGLRQKQAICGNCSANSARIDGSVPEEM